MAQWTDPSKQASAVGWLDNLYNSTLQYVAPNAAYANYIDSDQAAYPVAYYGSNLARLQQIKAKYDPGNFWNQQQGIPLPTTATAAG